MSWLPRGRTLSEGDFAWRHRLVCLVLALHVPLIVGIALAIGRGPLTAAAGSLPVVVLLGLALLPLGRRAQALAASLGLVVCSGVLVHLFSGRVELHFHYFVAMTIIALYLDWAVYSVAIGFVLVQQALLGLLSARGSYQHESNPWLWALIGALFLAGQSAVLMVFWRTDEVSRAKGDRLRVELSEGQSSVRARLADTDRIRADLIATVSHEFRTPLTGIRGAALTLLKRGDRLDEQSRHRMLAAILDQQERLSRLLENMLTAAGATTADPAATSEVDGVAAEVAMLAGANRPDSPPISVLVEPGTIAQMDRRALHQVLANLVDNAQQHGNSSSVPLVAAGRDDRGVWVTVSNEGRTLDTQATDRLFEPFTQAASGATRDAEGLGMGLYVVRRLVEVYGGGVDVRSEQGWVTVEVRLRSGLAPSN